MSNRGLSIKRFLISKPHPRKGTETQIGTAQVGITQVDFKTTSPQGDGTHEGRLYEAKNFVQPPLYFFAIF